MGVLEFISFIVTVIIIGITILGVVSIKYETSKLEEENEKLRRDLHNARKRKMEKEQKENAK